MQMIFGEETIRIFGERIEAARKKKGLTQEELAERVSVSQSMINHIENGNKKPSLETAVALANELGITLDSLISIV